MRRPFLAALVLAALLAAVGSANETAANAVIRRNVPLYDNAELVDWYTLAKANPSWLSADQLPGE